MAIINALNTGILGIQRGLAELDRSASTIASAESMSADNSADLVEPMVGLIQSRIQVGASARVVETVDEVLGTIIDVLA